MGAVEHLKTLCCLGLPPESAMIAVTPLLHEIVPHGWTRIALLKPDATISRGYSENPVASTIFRERMWRFMDDQSSPMSLWMSCFHSIGIGWTLQLQGRGWLERRWYREIEAPLDSCWVLDAMVGDSGKACAIVSLTRPFSAHRFTVEEVQKLNRLRPWLAHALRGDTSDYAHQRHNHGLMGPAGAPLLSGQMILKPDDEIIFQTSGIELLLRILAGTPANYTRQVPESERLPAPILKLLRCIHGAAKGTSHTPPRMQMATAHGIVTLEAKWLMPTEASLEDVAKDPKSCLIAVTIELREHAIAHAARVLRDSGATPTQMKVGIALATGKSKPVIAGELGIKPSSVADQTKRLYQTFDVHNSTELATKIWLGARPAGTCQPHAPSRGHRGHHDYAS